MRKITVLVTRPDPGGWQFCQELAAAGYEALHCPTIDYVPPDDPNVMRKGVAKLGEQDWIIFVSPHAVRTAVPMLRQHWPVLPDSVKFAAIGGGTAKALREAGYTISAVPETDWRTEGLLALAPFKSMQHCSVTIVRGEEGRPDLEVALQERGAHVMALAVYRRQQAQTDVKSFLTKLNNHEIDVIISTSFDGMRFLKNMLGEAAWPALQQVPIMVYGERLEMLATELGFKTVWPVAQMQAAAFHSLLDEKKEELCQNSQKK